MHPGPGCAGPWVCAEAPARADRGRGEIGARRADAMALTLRAAVEELSIPLARATAAFLACRGWEEMGFARLEDCARERFRRGGRWVRDLAALGEALERLPALARALTGDDGGSPLGRVAARLVGRVATPESLDAWVSLARRVCVRELKLAVRQSAPPAEAAELQKDAEPVLLRLAVPVSVRAAFDEAAELFRAVEGHESTLASFVEALVGEAASGPAPGAAWRAGQLPGAGHGLGSRAGRRGTGVSRRSRCGASARPWGPHRRSCRRPRRP